jgi:GntR family transcriptional repressor for pyruvate dehydrogenase complex
MIQKVYSSKLYESVIKQIKGMISQGLLKKGDMLPSEKVLTQMTGVSRVTVREALKILSEKGIIETKKGKGSFVIFDPDKGSIENILFSSIREIREDFEHSSQVRLMFEPEIARMAASVASDRDIEYLGDLVDSTKKAIDGNEDTAELFDRFHEVIIETLNNPVLTELFTELIDLERPSEAVAAGDDTAYSLRLATYNQHYKIYEAIKGHNGEFAYFYMKEHLLSVLSAYSKYFQNISD